MTADEVAMADKANNDAAIEAEIADLQKEAADLQDKVTRLSKANGDMGKEVGVFDAIKLSDLSKVKDWKGHVEAIYSQYEVEVELNAIAADGDASSVIAAYSKKITELQTQIRATDIEIRILEAQL